MKADEKIDDAMREQPTDPPEVVPAQTIEQPALGAAVGLAAFAKQNPEGGLTGNLEEDEAWHVQPAGSATDNDEDSHVRPTDNDGETVPR